MKTIFLFPGQGSQKPGLLASWSPNDPIVAPIWDDTRNILHEEPTSLDTTDRLHSTVFVQLSLLIHGVISARKLQSRGIHPDFVAGHSLGAFSAAVISGVLSFPEALSLVHTRASLMEQAFPHGYGMAAFTGIPPTLMSQILKSHHELYLSNINAADQVVVSGNLPGLNQLINELEQNGIVRKAQLLKTAVPSHCPLLEPVSQKLKVLLDQIPQRKPILPYASNHTGRLLKNSADVLTDLYRHLSSTLLWFDATSLLYELGGRIFIEMTPSGVLAKIAAATFPDAVILTMDPDNTDLIEKRWNSIINEN